MNVNFFGAKLYLVFIVTWIFPLLERRKRNTLFKDFSTPYVKRNIKKKFQNWAETQSSLQLSSSQPPLQILIFDTSVQRFR